MSGLKDLLVVETFAKLTPTARNPRPKPSGSRMPASCPITIGVHSRLPIALPQPRRRYGHSARIVEFALIVHGKGAGPRENIQSSQRLGATFRPTGPPPPCPAGG